MSWKKNEYPSALVEGLAVCLFLKHLAYSLEKEVSLTFDLENVSITLEVEGSQVIFTLGPQPLRELELVFQTWRQLTEEYTNGGIPLEDQQELLLTSQVYAEKEDWWEKIVAAGINRLDHLPLFSSE